jgi:LPS-assembly lipoprotein
MSSSDRRRFLALILGLPLAGCGFTPSYGPGASASALLGRVRADDPSNRDAFAFVARIEERLGLPQADAWRLSYRISTRRIDLAITTEGSILRYNIVGTVSWSLIDPATGATLVSGKAESFTGSAATTSIIAARTAEDNARGRLMIILADQIIAKLEASALPGAP